MPFIQKNTQRTLLPICLGVGLLLFSGCQTIPPFPPVKFSEPHWTVRKGQAIWKRNRQSPELVTDILVAVHPDGRSLVQLTKTPFPMLTAQENDRYWEVLVLPHERRFAGHGTPPKRLIWPRLPSILLQGTAPPAPWIFESLPDHRWRLSHPRTGEHLEGYLQP